MLVNLAEPPLFECLRAITTGNDPHTANKLSLNENWAIKGKAMLLLSDTERVSTFSLLKKKKGTFILEEQNEGT